MDQLIFFGSCLIAFGYAALLYWIMKGWDETNEWEVPQSHIVSTPVTVIVAARNEEQHIERLIESLLGQNIPKHLLTIIIIDDQSTDNTNQIAQRYASEHLQILKTTENGGKKAAIALGVNTATTDIIICTDADCIAPPNWLRLMLSFYEINKPAFLAGPIVYKTDRTLLQRFQYLDGVGNMGLTAAGIHHKRYYLANGANMLFERAAFDAVGGYANDSVASGDDMMLVQKIAAINPDKVSFLKSNEAAILTEPVKSVAELIVQRKRWASKSKHYSDKGIVWVQAYVFLVIVALVTNLILIPFTNGLSLYSFMFLLSLKLTIDFLYLSRLAAYFGDRKPLKSFFKASLWSIIYILWASLSAILPGTYQWKGRSVN